jgi:hypothetical protein
VSDGDPHRLDRSRREVRVVVVEDEVGEALGALLTAVGSGVAVEIRGKVGDVDVDLAVPALAVAGPSRPVGLRVAPVQRVVAVLDRVALLGREDDLVEELGRVRRVLRLVREVDAEMLAADRGILGLRAEVAAVVLVVGPGKEVV